MTISEILSKKVIPWVREQGVHRVVVVDDHMEDHELPSGMTVTRHKMRGRRVAIRGPREYGKSNNMVARWSEDGLEERLLPFLLCVVSGQVSIRAGERVIHCAEGHFILIPPRAPYLYGNMAEAIESGSIPDLMAFQTWDDHLQCRLGYASDTNLFFSNAAVIQQLDLLIEEALSRKPDSETIVSSMLVAFMTMLSRELAQGRSFGQSVTPVLTAPAAPDAIQRVQRYAKSNLGLPLTVDGAATMALMSRSQFIKQFRLVTGQSFMEYVTHCRIEEVKMLLQETDWSITRIHQYVGFKDATHLRDIFKKRVGMGLLEYRRTQRLLKKNHIVEKTDSRVR